VVAVVPTATGGAQTEEPEEPEVEEPEDPQSDLVLEVLDLTKEEVIQLALRVIQSVQVMVVLILVAAEDLARSSALATPALAE